MMILVPRPSTCPPPGRSSTRHCHPSRAPFAFSSPPLRTGPHSPFTPSLTPLLSHSHVNEFPDHERCTSASTPLQGHANRGVLNLDICTSISILRRTLGPGSPGDRLKYTFLRTSPEGHSPLIQTSSRSRATNCRNKASVPGRRGKEEGIGALRSCPICSHFH